MRLDMRVNGKTKLTGLIGDPLEHTVSPVLQNSLFSSMGINGIYIPLKVPGERLRDAVNGLKAYGFKGFNVTIPYKRAILKYLDEISEEAELLGAVNTVIIIEDKLTGDSRLRGYNTDGDGFIHAFHKQTGITFAGRKVCMLGAGGTARALTIKIALEKAESICIINRTGSKAQELAEETNGILERRRHCSKIDVSSITGYATGSNAPIRTVTASDFGSTEALHALQECDIIINATAVGMYPDSNASPLQDNFPFRRNQIVYDAIYNPSETKLMSSARLRGCIAINGSGMLFYQGVKAFEIWMDTIVPEKILNELSNEFMKHLQG